VALQIAGANWCALAAAVAVANLSSMEDRELALHQELQRFATQFCDRITQATEALERASPPEVRDEVLRKNLLYVSAAMEIAAGPFAEVGLLDMAVFVHLCRAVLERHWIPDLYGGHGHDLAEVFARSERELDELAERVLSPEQRLELSSLIDAWIAENPDQRRVEGIRLTDFAATAGSAAAERVLVARGLLASVKSATQAAQQSLLLAERGLFLFHRLPFLWRLQARLGAREMLADALAQLTEGRDAAVPRLARRAWRVAFGISLGTMVFGATRAAMRRWLRSRRARRPLLRALRAAS
jgi:hypothetical protein